MKFDFVIGNPPYQENIDNRGEQPPVYHFFYDEASKVATKVELITPARFLFNAGKTPSAWNKKMLSSNHFKVIKYFENSKDIFQNVDIKGGVAICCIDNSRNYTPIGEFIKEDEIRNILNKVLNKKEATLDSILYSNTSYKYDELFFTEHPEYNSRVSGGSKRYLSSSVFSKFPEEFISNATNKNKYAKIIGRMNNKREERYFLKKYLNPPDNFEKYKVFLSSSNGSGIFGEALTPPFVGEPNEGATETFVSFGSFRTFNEADNMCKYIKTKLLRFLLGTRKVTQGNKNGHVWQNVPLQKFSKNSDIDWSKSIKEIDKQLYKKYKLSKEEIDFIEQHVKEMN